MALGYGIVSVVQGKYAGTVGYYDNDEPGGGAMVYFSDPMDVGPYVMIRVKCLRSATKAQATAWGLSIGCNDYCIAEEE